MTEPNRPGDSSVRSTPSLHLPDLSHVQQDIGNAFAHAEQAIRPYDAFISRIGNPADLIHSVMTPQIVGRGFEVGAMRDLGQGIAHEPHILRDGRLILAEPRRAGRGEEGSEGPQAGPGRHLRPGEARAAEARAIASMRGAEGAQAHGHGQSQEHSLFEKVFLAHFEGGHVIAPDALKDGQFRFLTKSEKAWGEFFQRFAAFAMLKNIKPGDVQGLVFRGLVKPDGTLTPEGKKLLAQSKGVLVTDIHFLNGKTDKFARLGIAGQAADLLAKMNPGDLLRPEMMAELFKALGADFSYLSLSHKVVNPDMAKNNPTAASEAYITPEKMKEQAIREGVRDVTPGIALSAKTEQMVAEKLDLRPGIGRVAETVKGAGAAASMQGLFADKKKKRDSGSQGRRGEGDEDSPVFVPWYQHVFKPQKLKGKPRWWVPFTYFLGGSAVLLAAYYIFKYWMH